MATLSVVIPTYNMAQWLPVALESCLWQSHRELEIIVLNDGSTDASSAVAAAYARQDSRIRCITQPNGGLGAARQAGQDAATGEYITWLDADDFLTPDAAAHWLKPAEQEDVDMVCGNAVAFSDRTFNARRYFYHSPAQHLIFDSSPEYWKSKVVWRWIFSLPFIRKAGLGHRHFKLGQDVCYMYEALPQARAFAQCEPFVYYFRQEHKSAHASLEVEVEHQLAHFAEVRRVLLHAADGRARIKPLVKYLNENYWRDVRKLTPRMQGADAPWLQRAVDISLQLFDGLDPQWFRAAQLAPEVPEETAFLPLVDALTRQDRSAVEGLFTQLRDVPPHAPNKGSLLHTLRHRVKALVHPLARTARAHVRELEQRAVRRLSGNDVD